MSSVADLIAVMARLRDPDGGCPWDLAQTFDSVIPYTLEEAYEVADAIECQDMDALKGELGDLLFQVVFHARMAEEVGAFTFSDVVAAIVEKMIRRHPHVFGDAVVADAAEQTEVWEQLKLRERQLHGDASLLAGVARGLPALMRAEKVQRRAARSGFDGRQQPDELLGRMEEEIAALRQAIDEGGPMDVASDIGDLLFNTVELARLLQHDAEASLRHATARFEQRFRTVEARLKRDGDCSVTEPAEMAAEWGRIPSEE